MPVTARVTMMRLGHAIQVDTIMIHSDSESKHDHHALNQFLASKHLYVTGMIQPGSSAGGLLGRRRVAGPGHTALAGNRGMTH